MEATVKLYSYDYSDVRTYLSASLFVLGNLLLPQVCHLVSQGGMILLPIYFFTLIGAYKYGWRVGLLSALLSAPINSLFFGMPMPVVLPAILAKSVLLALAAGVAAAYFKRISIPILLLVVLSYQLMGTLIEWILVGNLNMAVQDFRIGLPGMALQVFGGFLVIKYLIKR